MHSTFADQIASSSEHSNVLTLAICFESKTNGPTTLLVRENVWGTKRHGFVVMSDLRTPHATLVLGIDCVVLCYLRSPQSAPRCTQNKAQLLVSALDAATKHKLAASSKANTSSNATTTKLQGDACRKCCGYCPQPLLLLDTSVCSTPSLQDAWLECARTSDKIAGRQLPVYFRRFRIDQFATVRQKPQNLEMLS